MAARLGAFTDLAALSGAVKQASIKGSKSLMVLLNVD